MASRTASATSRTSWSGSRREGIANLQGPDRLHPRRTASTATSRRPASSALADQPYQVEEFRAWVDEAAEYGRARSSSSTATPSRRRSTHRSGTPGCTGRRVATSSLDPAKLCRGIARVAARARRARSTSTRGSPGSSASPAASTVRTDAGATVRAEQVVVATSAYSGWLRRLSPLFVPVYDYVLVSEPLTPDERASIGWARRQGLSDVEQPVPLLPPDRGRPDPVGRLRRHPLLREPGRPGARPAAGDVREARGPVLPRVPAARGPALPVPLGRRRSTRPRGSPSRSGRRWAAG